MYDKKQALGFILIIMVVMTYTQFVFAPQQAPQQPSLNPASNPNSNVSGPAGQQAQLTQTNPQIQSNTSAQEVIPAVNTAKGAVRIPTLSEVDNAPNSIIQTGLSTITITHLGARKALNSTI